MPRDEVRNRFINLSEYGEQHLNDDVRIDYFAVSLPDLLIFDDDLNKRNQIHCNYLMALGKLGLGQFGSSEEHFNKILEMDASHQGAIIHKKMIKDDLVAVHDNAKN